MYQRSDKEMSGHNLLNRRYGFIHEDYKSHRVQTKINLGQCPLNSFSNLYHTSVVHIMTIRRISLGLEVLVLDLHVSHTLGFVGNWKSGTPKNRDEKCHDTTMMYRSGGTRMSVGVMKD